MPLLSEDFTPEQQAEMEAAEQRCLMVAYEIFSKALPDKPYDDSDLDVSRITAEATLQAVRAVYQVELPEDGYVDDPAAIVATALWLVTSGADEDLDPEDRKQCSPYAKGGAHFLGFAKACSAMITASNLAYDANLDEPISVHGVALAIKATSTQES